MEKQSILVYLEASEGQILKVSLEALHAAQQLASQTAKPVAAILTDKAAASAAAAYGADEVLTVELGEYQPEAYASMLAELFQRYDASALLLGATRDGKELAARTAAAVKAGCVTDAMSLTSDGWVRSIYGGSLQETVAVNGKAVVSVRSGTFGKPEEQP